MCQQQECSPGVPLFFFFLFPQNLHVPPPALAPATSPAISSSAAIIFTTESTRSSSIDLISPSPSPSPLSQSDSSPISSPSTGMANPDDRLYDVVGPRVARQPRRARTVNYPPNSAFTNYAVPRSVKPPSPPPPRAIPPAVPPRNKTNGEGDTFSSSLPNTYVTGSPSDRMGLMSPIRNRTTSSSSQPGEATHAHTHTHKIGRASCRESV